MQCARILTSRDSQVGGFFPHKSRAHRIKMHSPICTGRITPANMVVNCLMIHSLAIAHKMLVN